MWPSKKRPDGRCSSLWNHRAKNSFKRKRGDIMKRMRWFDYITINIYWLGLTTLSQTVSPLVFPLLVQRFVGEAGKGTFFGTLRLWTLMVALLVQALMGMFSDRSTLRWGRRRPFIFVGTLADLVFIAAVGLSASLEGMTGYWFLFAMAILLSAASNTAHGAVQGLIPDLVPEHQRGRFSGVKAVFEIPIPVILVAFTVGPLIAKGNMWGGILVAMGILTLAMLVTMLVREEPLRESLPLDWAPFLRLVLMTALFTAIILGMREVVKSVGRLTEGVSSATVLVFIMGAVGLVGMAIAVTLGVWASVRISIGNKAARANPSFTWWVVNRLAFLVGTTNLSGFAVYFLQGRLGYAEEKAAGPASQLMMVVGLFILVSALPSGWLADRFGSKRLVVISGVLAALGTLIILLSPSLTPIYVGGCLIGVAAGLFFTANWALGTGLVPKEEAGRYLGISNLAGAGAGAVGAYIGGPIADYFTVQVPGQPGLGYVLLFAIYGVLFLLSAVTLVKVRPTLGQERA
ncbi:MAG: SLC45 family MFS transporter [Chloroflexi bacterium]|nr:SLC45 family MFS transporter [Chloroflexota bacterium]